MWEGELFIILQNIISKSKIIVVIIIIAVVIIEI